MLSLIGRIKNIALPKKIHSFIQEEKNFRCYLRKLYGVLCIYPESVRFFSHGCDIGH